MNDSPRRIHIHFHPRQGGSPFAVEKEEKGQKRRYLEGITSGLQNDGHGERMTESCIKSFQRQAESGDILLYAGNHGTSYTEDIGMLVASGIDAGGDWWTRYRLYDESDGMGPQTLEASDKVWRQINGLPPYNTPQERGFSIEGNIPDGGLQFVDKDGRRVMDDILLDGVWLVRRPSYRSSMAHAVAKAIGAPIPGKVRKSLQDSLRSAVQLEEDRSAYFDACYRLQDALDREIKSIVGSGEPDRRDQLEALFDEYSQMMIPLVMENEGVITADHGSVAAEAAGLYSEPNQVEQDLADRLTALKDQLIELVNNRKRSIT
jgi:hypothetical protein